MDSWLLQVPALFGALLQEIWSSKGYVLFLSIPIVISVMAFEAWYLGWRRSSLRRIIFEPTPSSRLDLAICAMYATHLNALVAFLMTFGLISIVPNVARQLWGYDFVYLIPNIYLQLLVYVLLYDFLWYWKHRLAHHYAWWWHLHEVHHSATDMNMIAANRFHPVDTAIGELMVSIPLALAGAPPEGYFVARLVILVHGHLIHSNLPWTWGWFGRYLVISPAGHRIHHSGDVRQQNRNFGTLTPLWDRMFGTWTDETEVLAAVEERGNFHSHPFYVDLWQSYLRSLRSLRKKIVRMTGLGVKSAASTPAASRAAPPEPSDAGPDLPSHDE